MNFLQLVLKQMRQRALGTWLTMLSVVLGVALATGVMIVKRGSVAMFEQSEFGYDIIVGPPKGSALQLVLNTVYQIDSPAGVVPYAVYEELLAKPRDIKHAIPIAAGDTFRNYRIVATLPKMFGYTDTGEKVTDENAFQYRMGRRYEFAQGKVFHPLKFEAVIGSEVAEREKLKLGDEVTASHGGVSTDEHAEHWKIVGILGRTYTAADRVVYVPLVSYFAIGEHEQGMEAQARLRAEFEAAVKPPAKPAEDNHDHDGHAHEAATTPAATQPGHDAHEDHDDHAHAPATAPATSQATAHADHEGHDHEEHFDVKADGTIDLKLPTSAWQFSAILVRSRVVGFGTSNTAYQYRVVDTRATAAVPAMEMRKFFDLFLAPSAMLLSGVSYLVTIVAGVGILVSIYNSISARTREIAILRALGATRGKILGLICAEAGLIGLVGGIGGLIVGHGIGAIASYFVRKLVGEGFNWINVPLEEWLYLLAVVGLSVLAGLVPALKAYRTPVADNLVSG